MAQFKILVSDSLSEEGLAVLKAEPQLEVTVKTGMNPEELANFVGPFHGLIVRSASKVTAAVVEKAHNMKVIGRAGSGVDNIDVPAATAKGIVVQNAPGANSASAAELAIAMMFSVARHTARGTCGIKKGLWEKKQLEGVEVGHKTLGVIGLGAIGSITADYGRGLHMTVLGYDPFVTKKDGVTMVSLDELLAKSDYITLHVGLNDKTRGMIGAAQFARMKDGVILINCARGGIVDEKALVDALKSGKVRGAGVDVFEKEPVAADHPLLGLDNVVLTPHIGASTIEAQLRVGIMTAEQVRDFLLKGENRNAVNKI